MTGTRHGDEQAIRAALPSVVARLPAFLPAQRWFGNKHQAVARVEIRDTAILADHASTLLVLVDVVSGSSAPVTYFLPLSLAHASEAALPGEIVATHGDFVVRDAIGDPETCRALLRGMLAGQTLPTALGGQFVFQPVQRHPSAGESPVRDLDSERLAVRHAGVEQSNSSVIFGQELILKALRRLAHGLNPEIEIPRFLGEHTTFDRVPALVGWAEYQGPDGSAAPVGVLQRFVPNQGDGWSYVLRRVQTPEAGSGADLIADLAALGQTLAELHLALASCRDVPEFAPEPFTVQDAEQFRRRTEASLTDVLHRVGGALARGDWSAADRRDGEAIRDGAARLRDAIGGIDTLADGRTVKTRHHGDFHLGQTLVSGDGWIIIDFEGEPLRSLTERRARQTPLRDVAGLLRSLDYAHATVVRQSPAAVRADLAALFADCRQSVLDRYVETIRGGGARLLPLTSEDQTRALLALELEKALYELIYELGNRPDWVSIPLSALSRLAQTA